MLNDVTGDERERHKEDEGHQRGPKRHHNGGTLVNVVPRVFRVTNKKRRRRERAEHEAEDKKHLHSPMMETFFSNIRFD